MEPDSNMRNPHELTGWPCHRNALEGVDSLGAGFRAGPGVSVFRTGNVHPGAGIFIGEDVMLFDHVRLLLGDADTRLTIGNRVVINVGAYVSGEGGLQIGDDVLIGPHAKLLSAGHEIHEGHLEVSRNPIIGMPIRVGAGAWIGAGAIVMPGVTIGEGAVVGAGSVVTRDVPARMVVAGNPARVLHARGRQTSLRQRWSRLAKRMLTALGVR